MATFIKCSKVENDTFDTFQMQLLLATFSRDNCILYLTLTCTFNATVAQIELNCWWWHHAGGYLRFQET